jgi:hypothetical protein
VVEQHDSPHTPVLRNKLAIGEGKTTAESGLDRECQMSKSQCLRKGFKVEGSRFKMKPSEATSCIPTPTPSRTRRATSSYETSQHPKYFPNYFKNVQNSRVSFKDLKDAKMRSSTFLTFDKPREILKSREPNGETSRRREMWDFPGRQGCPKDGHTAIAQQDTLRTMGSHDAPGKRRRSSGTKPGWGCVTSGSNNAERTTGTFFPSNSGKENGQCWGSGTERATFHCPLSTVHSFHSSTFHFIPRSEVYHFDNIKPPKNCETSFVMQSVINLMARGLHNRPFSTVFAEVF